VSTVPAKTKNTSSRATTRHSRQESRARIIAAATGLVRERAYSDLSVGEVMERAGFERTIFYRHFDDLGDLLIRAGQESIEGLFDAQVDLGATRDGSGTRPGAIRDAIWPVVNFYELHGPLLRALDEAAASEEAIAAAQEALRERFDTLVAESLSELPQFSSVPPAEVREIAHALNLLNVSFLLEAFGREPRVSAEEAVDTLTTIWTAVIFGPRPSEIGA
jgi:TetR/AcrR family transcriptional regulator, ethionamide resistance regulator